MKKLKQFRQGAASFYVVVFATLILTVIVASFAAVIASEITRTSNDDLSQSAYDSAMAGVEDAKLAYYNYRNCLAQGATKAEPDNDGAISCGEIIWYVETNEAGYDAYNVGKDEIFKIDRCNMINYILGRSDGTIVESRTANNMQQEYTCVEIDDSLGDYRSTISSSDTMKVVKVKFDDVEASKIKSVKISWYANDGSKIQYTNFNTSEVTFPNASDSNVSVPPTISLGLIQTSSSFNFSDFDLTQNGTTDRGMIYLVPASEEACAAKNNEETDKNYEIAYNNETKTNHIEQTALSKSNDKTIQNLPYVVVCKEGSEFLCSATVDLPEPVGGSRNNNTFVFMVGLPYGKPVTDFSLEFYCDDGEICGHEDVADETSVATNKANLKGVQVNIDSTGRANDLYRRLEVRLESESDYSLSVFGPVELFNNSDDDDEVSLEKVIERVTSEYNF